MLGRRRNKESQSDPESSRPGWDAITAAMTALYGSQQPRHWGAAQLVGSPRLDGVSAYDAGDHWHFVTLGLSEIGMKESDYPAISGLGFEYTMRVRRRPGDEPPDWVTRLLSLLGETALGGQSFPAGHTLDPGGPIAGRDGNALEGLCFLVDPALPTMATPNGAVSFIQVVGVTRRELDDIVNDYSRLAALAGRDGLFVTDPDR